MWINGRTKDTISALDRGLLYGDGAFETILLKQHRPVLLLPHLQRLQKTCLRLQIDCPLPLLRQELEAFLAVEPVPAENAILKIIVTRGEGGRGYRPAGTLACQRILQLHPFPETRHDHAREGITVQLCQHPVSSNYRLAGFKHLNRLDQVLASMELREEVTEGLMFDENDLVIEGTRSNLFMVLANTVCTPLLNKSGVAGILRDALLAAFQHEGVRHHIRSISRQELFQASEIFICNSLIGIWPVTGLITESEMIRFDIGPHTRHAQQLLQAIMAT
ncbi:MAG: aminodeoxychorismate lyase [Pseudomonadales bacterium]|nr:aminodeoxychorismate lyase [Pseudomonadales bacterium]